MENICTTSPLNGLKIDPCIPDTLKNYHCERTYRGAVYHIEIDNAAGVQHGIRNLIVNGKKVPAGTASGALIPLKDNCNEYYVNVEMG